MNISNTFSKNLAEVSKALIFENSHIQVLVSRHLMSSHLIFFLRWLLMRCLLMRNLLTFSTKKSHMSRYLKSSLLTSLYRFIHQDARRLLMSDLFVEKVSRFLMSRHLMSSHLKKKKRRLLMRCLLIDIWPDLKDKSLRPQKFKIHNFHWKWENRFWFAGLF